MNSPLSHSLDNLKAQIAQLEEFHAKIKSPARTQLEQMPQPEQAALALSDQQKSLLGLFDEFVTTDEGRALAASLQRFARFVQSKQAKM